MEGFRHTKIVATLGPASSDYATLKRMVEAGLDVARLNFSHGDHEEKAAVIDVVRRVEAESGRPIAILQDLQGPKIRVGPIPGGPIELVAGASLAIYTDGREGGRGAISVTYPELDREVSPGDAIFIDDGLIELRAVEVAQGVVGCEVVVGGEVSTAKGVNLPGVRLSAPALTEKDRADLRFGLERGVDYVALSFVRSPNDAREARLAMGDAGVPVIAKVEKREAVDQMEATLRAFDGAMVARGDLGIEMRAERVPAVQKRLISTALYLERPVITATQMLESMTENRRPTRAEASDVANAVLDGTHAVMLSGETAIGRYPVEAIEAMHRIVVEAERLVERPHLEGPARSNSHGVCRAAVHLAADVDAEAIVAFTRSGNTAETLSSLGPGRPIVALCDSVEVARRLCLWRSVMPLVIGPAQGGESAYEQIERELSERRLLPAESRIVSVGAAPGSRAGQTNFIRLHRL